MRCVIKIGDGHAVHFLCVKGEAPAAIGVFQYIIHTFGITAKSD